jgi:hypothetical protein
MIELNLTQSGLIIQVGNNGAVALTASHPRFTCPGCDTAYCNRDCDSSKSDSALESDYELADRFRFNGAFDGMEATVLALASTVFRNEFRDVESYKSLWITLIDCMAVTAIDAIENNVG